MENKDLLNFVVNNYLNVSAAADIKFEMIEWAKENNLKARCLGIFICQHSFDVQIRWLVPDEKEKTMFNLRWKT